MLATHADTLFPVIAVGVSLRELRSLPHWLAGEVRAALADEGFPEGQLGPLEPAGAVLARSCDRSVLGHLTQLAFEVEFAVASCGGWDGVDVEELNWEMRRTLRSRGRGYVVPLELVHERTERRPSEAEIGSFPDDPGATEVAEVTTLHLTVSLEGAEPPVIRTLEVPAALDLERRYRLLQRAFGWMDYHPSRFARGSVWDEQADLYLCDFDVREDATEGTPVRQGRLSELLRAVGDQLGYLYDTATAGS